MCCDLKYRGTDPAGQDFDSLHLCRSNSIMSHFATHSVEAFRKIMRMKGPLMNDQSGPIFP